ncbi:hypothetical protein FA15DRAFT_42038 [Coprinopsis marcescibilis]|uniref:Uncharacterized protein n=1 Tax=Coprinopsis marcescibilis TaxID=230819 RepID=A0A5C3L912_COPMA|nr:hypothetical protein FA15DRAFT_42038 [Coprinopsis marcescibilis]
MTSLKRLNIQLGVKQIGNFVDWITTCPVISLVQLEEVMCKQSRWALNANDNYYQLHCEFRKKAAELLHRQLPHLTKLALQHNDYAVLPSEWPDLKEAQDTTAELQEWFKGLNSQNLQMVQLNCWFRNWTNPSPDDRAIWPEVATLLEDLVLWLSERAWVVHLKIATFKFASEPPETKKSELAELFPRLSDRTNRLKVEFVARKSAPMPLYLMITHQHSLLTAIDFRDVYPDHTSFFVI